MLSIKMSDQRCSSPLVKRVKYSDVESLSKFIFHTPSTIKNHQSVYMSTYFDLALCQLVWPEGPSLIKTIDNIYGA